MLLVIVDLLEKLLAWLKPFTARENQAPKRQEQDPSARPRSHESLNQFESTLPELPVIQDLKALMNDKKINKNPTVRGGLFEHGSDRMFYGPVKADPAVWYAMNLKYSSQYLVHWNEA